MKPRAPISVVHIASGDLWAGAEVQLFTLAKTLHDIENVSVRVILLNHGELENRLREVGIPVDVLDETRLNSLQIFWQLRKLLSKWQPNVVHTHRIKENILGSIAAKLAGNIPSLRTVHGSPEHRPGWRKPHKQLLYVINRLVGRFLQHKIISVSDELAEKLKKEYPAQKISVIENGVDYDAIVPYLISQESEDGAKINSPVKIGIVGRLVPVKRVDLFIKIAHHMNQYYPSRTVHFHIYGDGSLRSDLEKLSTELGLQDIVRFEGHCNNILQQIALLNALIITSDHEGLPMTLLETMVLKVPVISHSVGGIPKVLGNGTYGYMIATQSVSEYGLAILNILDNPNQAIELVDAAQQHVRTSYTSKYNADQYLNQYHAILENMTYG